jgi:hypothetical protein
MKELFHIKIAIGFMQRVTKKCRLSWLTISALVHEPKSGGGGGVGSQPMSTELEFLKSLWGL